jgi:hypothetical protein
MDWSATGIFIFSAVIVARRGVEKACLSIVRITVPPTTSGSSKYCDSFFCPHHLTIAERSRVPVCTTHVKTSILYAVSVYR